SRDGEFVCAGLLFSFRRHIEITLITSLPTVRQAEKLLRKMKGRELSVHDVSMFQKNCGLRNSNFARFDVFCLRQRQSDNALIDFCADLISVDRWIELERSAIILLAQFTINQCASHVGKRTAPKNCQLVVLD